MDIGKRVHKLSCALRNGWLVCFLMAPFYLMLNKLLEWKLRLTQAYCLWSEKLRYLSRGLVFTTKISIYIRQTEMKVTHYCCPNAFPRLLVPAKGVVRESTFPWKDWLTHTACVPPHLGEPCCRPCWKSKPLTGCWAPGNLHQTAMVLTHAL